VCVRFLLARNGTRNILEALPRDHHHHRPTCLPARPSSCIIEHHAALNINYAGDFFPGLCTPQYICIYILLCVNTEYIYTYLRIPNIKRAGVQKRSSLCRVRTGHLSRMGRKQTRRRWTSSCCCSHDYDDAYPPENRNCSSSVRGDGGGGGGRWCVSGGRRVVDDRRIYTRYIYIYTHTPGMP